MDRQTDRQNFLYKTPLFCGRGQVKKNIDSCNTPHMKPAWKWWVTRRAASLTYLAASDAKRWRSKAVWSLKGRSCRKMPIKFQQPIKVRTIVPARQRARNLMHRRLGSARGTFLSLIHILNTRLKNFHNFHRFDIKYCGDSLPPLHCCHFNKLLAQMK